MYAHIAPEGDGAWGREREERGIGGREAGVEKDGGVGEREGGRGDWREGGRGGERHTPAGSIGGCTNIFMTPPPGMMGMRALEGNTLSLPINVTCPC